jgi:endonuclease G
MGNRGPREPAMQHFAPFDGRSSVGDRFALTGVARDTLQVRRDLSLLRNAARRIAGAKTHDLDSSTHGTGRYRLARCFHRSPPGKGGAAMLIPSTPLLLGAARRFANHFPSGAHPLANERVAVPRASAREQYLGHRLAKEHARNAVAQAEAAGARAPATSTILALAQERIIGRSDLVDVNYLELAVAIARGVARIRLRDGYGTGFLVGPRLLMTNHHVLPDRSAAMAATAQFDYQENSAHQPLPVEEFSFDTSTFVTNEELDFTLVAIAERSASGRAASDYPWTKLIAASSKIDKGEAINIIQHPLGGLKQIALRNNEVLELPSGRPDFLYYTTDTQPGASGAPCFNDQWELVALHHVTVPKTAGGRILKKDGTPYREGQDDASTIEWIGNEGARVSAIVDAVQSTKLDGAAARACEQALVASPPNPVELARAAGTLSLLAQPEARRTGARIGTGNGHGVSVVVNIDKDDIQSISITHGAQAVQDGPPDRTHGAQAIQDQPLVRGPTPASAPAPAPAPAVPSTSMETTSLDPDWSSREGYDPDFLGIRVDLPKLNKAQLRDTFVVPEEYRKETTNGQGKYVLPYHHYSLAFNRKRRVAWYSAANVDGDRRFRFDRGKDKWRFDPRIDDASNPTLQMGDELYATADTDRGHLTRYLDVAWGDSKDEAIAATNDTFVFANCALQLSAFNQGKERWQGIEQFLLEQKARKEKRRMIAFTGPVFTSSDPTYRCSAMDYSARLPLSFWKVCVLVREDGTLAATGFVLGQPKVAQLPDVEERFDVTAAQVTIAHLEQLTGLDFGPLKSVDHLASGGEPGTLEVMHADKKFCVRALRTLDDIAV